MGSLSVIALARLPNPDALTQSVIASNSADIAVIPLPASNTVSSSSARTNL